MTRRIVPSIVASNQFSTERRRRSSHENQWCQNSASTMMIGRGMPSSHNNKPRPKPIVVSITEISKSIK
jgi:hypothetical protein